MFGAGDSDRRASSFQSPNEASSCIGLPISGLAETPEEAQRSLSQSQQASQMAQHQGMMDSQQQGVMDKKAAQKHHCVCPAEARDTKENEPANQAMNVPLEIEIDLGDAVSEEAAEGSNQAASFVRARTGWKTSVANQSRSVLQEMRQQSSSQCRHQIQVFHQSAVAPAPKEQSVVERSTEEENLGLDVDLFETGLWSP